MNGSSDCCEVSGPEWLISQRIKRIEMLCDLTGDFRDAIKETTSRLFEQPPIANGVSQPNRPSASIPALDERLDMLESRIRDAMDAYELLGKL